MNFLKSINYKVFFTALGVIIILFFISYFGAIARSDGEPNIVVNFLTGLCYVLAGPIILILDFFKIINPITLFIGLSLNLLLNSLIVERITTKYKSKKNLQ